MMEENNGLDTIENKNSNKSVKETILDYDNDDKQTLFRFLGIELTAPKGLKNPRLVYISFIVINFLLIFFLKNLISSR